MNITDIVDITDQIVLKCNPKVETILDHKINFLNNIIPLLNFDCDKQINIEKLLFIREPWDIKLTKNNKNIYLYIFNINNNYDLRKHTHSFISMPTIKIQDDIYKFIKNHKNESYLILFIKVNNNKEFDDDEINDLKNYKDLKIDNLFSYVKIKSFFKYIKKTDGVVNNYMKKASKNFTFNDMYEKGKI